MNVKQPVTDTITIGDQPDEGDLRAFKDEGYVGIVNLRNDGEPEQPLGTAEEREVVQALGLDYLHVGVGSTPLTVEGVTSFSAFLDKHAEAKTLVHCRKSGRAAALVALYLAQKGGWEPESVAMRAGKLGLRVEGGLKHLVEAYLREHGGA